LTAGGTSSGYCYGRVGAALGRHGGLACPDSSSLKGDFTKKNRNAAIRWRLGPPKTFHALDVSPRSFQYFVDCWGDLQRQVV
jgi:hypothetical protein